MAWYLLFPIAASASIYGEDDRAEVYEHQNQALVEVARTSLVAMGRGLPPQCDQQYETNGDSRDLCPGEMFEEQPVIAACSATIVDDDLVLTAAHCVPDQATCDDVWFSGGVYYDDAESLHPVGASDVYKCVGIVVEAEGDAVVVQVDRPFQAPYVPALPAREAVEIGDEVALMGFGGGIPAKIVSGCHVLGGSPARPEFNCDMLPGNSGSPMLTPEGELWGVLHAGAGSYVPDGDCRVPMVYTEEGLLPDLPTAPQLAAAIPLESVLEALCELEWPTSLCATAAVCGDQICSGGETYQVCDDCERPTCGDGSCELAAESHCDDCVGFVCDVDAGEHPVDEGCGCRSGPGRTSGWLVLIALVAARTFVGRSVIWSDRKN